MKVALYKSHHSLPFWHSPENPYGLFNPDILHDWSYQHYGEVCGKNPATEHFMMPVLNGLLALDIPGALANVSIIFDTEKKLIFPPSRDRYWIQITTEPKKWKKGLPVVVNKNGKVKVYDLWGGDNGTYDPYQLIKETPKELHSAKFWTKFFLNRLRETKKKIEKKAKEATEELRIYSIIP